jgi:hypothetical protein
MANPAHHVFPHFPTMARHERDAVRLPPWAADFDRFATGYVTLRAQFSKVML